MRYHKSVSWALAVSFLAGVLFSAPARSQNIFGAIVGTVSDPTGAVLPGRTVMVTNLATGEKRTATTDGQGKLPAATAEYSAAHIARLTSIKGGC